MCACYYGNTNAVRSLLVHLSPEEVRCQVQAENVTLTGQIDRSEWIGRLTAQLLRAHT